MKIEILHQLYKVITIDFSWNCIFHNLCQQECIIKYIEVAIMDSGRHLIGLLVNDKKKTAARLESNTRNERKK